MINIWTKYRIVSKIKGLAAEIKRINQAIKENKKDNRWQWQGIKHALATDARHHQLAYAYLRGVPYKFVEISCGEHNKPSLLQLLRILEANGWVYYRDTSNQLLVEEWLKAELIVEKVEQAPIKELPKLNILQSILGLLQ